MKNKNKPSPNVVKLLGLMAESCGTTRSPAGAELLARDLSRYEESQVIEALQRCRFEVARFPTLAEIIQRIPDGRPGVEESWALCPKTEEGSVVWNDEIAEAFAVARPLLLSGDDVAARMAFREAYTKILSEARAKGTRPKWVPSLGTDRFDRSRALQEAVEKKRISTERAVEIDPQIQLPSHLDPLGITQKSVRQLTGPREKLTRFDPLKELQKIREKIEANSENENGK